MARKKRSKSSGADPEIITDDIAIKDYRPHPDNYNGHDSDQVRMMEASLRAYNQPKTVTVWEHPHGYEGVEYKGYFVTGHGLRMAAQKAKWTHLRASILPADYPESKVKGFMVADNHIPSHATPDKLLLAKVLDEVRANDGEDFMATGYDEAALDKMMQEITRQSLKAEKSMPPVSSAGEEPWLDVELGSDADRGADSEQSPPLPDSGGDIESLVIDQAKKLAGRREVVQQVTLMYGELDFGEYENMVAALLERTAERDEAGVVLAAVRALYGSVLGEEANTSKDWGISEGSGNEEMGADEAARVLAEGMMG